MGTGIEESKDVLIAVNELCILLLTKFKDGVQLSDFTSIFAAITLDSEFKSKIQEAYVGAKAIPAEVLDIDVAETIELSSLQLSYIPKILAAIRS